MALNVTDGVGQFKYLGGVQIWSFCNDYCVYLQRGEREPESTYGPLYATVFFGKGETEVTGPKNWEPA